jgi:hypothetical protein
VTQKLLDAENQRLAKEPQRGRSDAAGGLMRSEEFNKLSQAYVCKQAGTDFAPIVDLFLF